MMKCFAIAFCIILSTVIIEAFFVPTTRPTTQRSSLLVLSLSSSQSQSNTDVIVTGPKGKPATSREEDLQWTMQIIRKHWKEQDQSEILSPEEELPTADETQEVIGVSTKEPEPTVAEAERKDEEQAEDHSAVAAAEGGVVAAQDALETLRAFLSSDPSYAPVLARIASGCAPAGHGLHPQKIESVSVISLTTRQIEIAALVCADGDCVNVAVPVAFPNPCDDDDDYFHTNDSSSGVKMLEECIRANLQQLDATAHIRIQEEEYKEVNFEKVQEKERIMNNLREEPQFAELLPDWWTKPVHDFELQDECSLLKGLLNEDDFCTEIRLLAELQQLRQQEDDDSHPKGPVTHAAVALIGTSGMLLRALLVEEDEKNKHTMVDLPVQFGKEVHSVSELRSIVLELVDSVMAT